MYKGLKRIRQKKISEQVYDQIRDMIQSGQINPNEKLLPERELAALLGVSRSSVREAILKLECLGLVQQRHGEGTFIRSVTENELSPVFEAFLRNHRSIFDLMEIRSVLEAWAASAAAKRATQEQIVLLRKCLEAMRKAKHSGEIGYQLNLEFHRLISMATHNTLLVHIMNTLSGWFQQLTSEVYTKVYNNPSLQDILFLQHEAIVTAIENHDPEAANQAMMQHLDYARKQIPKENIDQFDSFDLKNNNR